MKRFGLILLMAVICWGCDDGEFIVTNFNFDQDSNLQLCQSGAENVLYIVNTEPDESISFNFADTTFTGTYRTNASSITRTIQLGGNNKLVYRTYDGPVGAGYFCSGIPPTAPKVTEEYKNVNGGTIDVITTILEQKIDTIDSLVTRTFITRAVAHDVTLKNTTGDEEIVEETLQLGSFTKTAQYNLSDLIQ